MRLVLRSPTDWTQIFSKKKRVQYLKKNLARYANNSRQHCEPLQAQTQTEAATDGQRGQYRMNFVGFAEGMKIVRSSSKPRGRVMRKNVFARARAALRAQATVILPSLRFVCIFFSVKI